MINSYVKRYKKFKFSNLICILHWDFFNKYLILKLTNTMNLNTLLNTHFHHYEIFFMKHERFFILKKLLHTENTGLNFYVLINCSFTLNNSEFRN